MRTQEKAITSVYCDKYHETTFTVIAARHKGKGVFACSIRCDRCGDIFDTGIESATLYMIGKGMIDNWKMEIANSL